MQNITTIITEPTLLFLIPENNPKPVIDKNPNNILSLFLNTH